MKLLLAKPRSKDSDARAQNLEKEQIYNCILTKRVPEKVVAYIHGFGDLPIMLPHKFFQNVLLIGSISAHYLLHKLIPSEF
jgi:hypothetical protein